MSPSASAYANSDVAIISWKYPAKIPNCLGFCIQREDTSTHKLTTLPAWVGFKGQSNPDWKMKDTAIWPIQKYSWKDLTAPKNSSYIYHIIPMIGKPGALKPSTDKTLLVQTKPVAITPGSGPIKAWFNRGILSTQFIAHALPKSKTGKKGPSKTELLNHIVKPGDKLRTALAGDFISVVPSLLDRAMQEGGFCYLALYELTDPELLGKLKAAKKSIEMIVSNADGATTSTDSDGKKHSKKILDGENKKWRAQLKKAGVTIHDRFVPSGHIGHNKFVLYCDKDSKPTAVLTGSTNWTATALCAQSNNVILIEDADFAQAYSDYWDRLLQDTEKNDSKQGADLRKSDTKRFQSSDANPGVWFSPNTPKATKPAKGSVDIDNDPNQPADLKDMFDAIEAAEKSILFLEFQPGSPSVLDKILSVQQRKPSLFIRGAATDPNAIEDYNTALFHGDSALPDVYNVVAAAAIGDQFSYWESELLSAGHAIIHSKVVVVDPFTTNCKVFTGSHNHGYRASAFNDENLLCVKGEAQLAAAYAANVIDIYDHYRFRYMLLQDGKNGKGKNLAFQGLDVVDTWQDKYFGSVGTPPVPHMTVPHPQS